MRRIIQRIRYRCNRLFLNVIIGLNQLIIFPWADACKRSLHLFIIMWIFYFAILLSLFFFVYLRHTNNPFSGLNLYFSFLLQVSLNSYLLLPPEGLPDLFGVKIKLCEFHEKEKTKKKEKKENWVRCNYRYFHVPIAPSNRFSPPVRSPRRRKEITSPRQWQMKQSWHRDPTGW